MMPGRVAVALGCCLSTAVWQTPRDAIRPPAGTAVIAGTVRDVHGSPLAGARVMTNTPFTSGSGPAVRISRVVQTDASGRYVLDALPAGTYVVHAALPGFTTALFGASADVDTPVAIVLTEGERFEAPIVLPPLAVVLGTVLDEFGEPAVATVTFFVRSPSTSGSRALRQIAATESNRRGRYRIEGLPKGRYLVRAERQGFSNMRRADPEAIALARQAIERPSSPLPADAARSEQPLTYVPVYYPGVTGSQSATAVAVAPGVERAGIDLQLRVVPAAAIEGELIDSSGALLPHASTWLIGEDEAQERFGPATADGRFNFTGVPTGRYVLAASFVTQPQQPGGKRQVLWGSREVFVGPGQRIEPVLTLQPGTDISGIVVFGGEDPPDVIRNPMAQLIGLDGPFTRLDLPRSVATIDRGSAGARIVFESVPPGRYVITPISLLSDQWWGRSAMRGGRDVSAIPFDVPAGQPLNDLVITFGRGPTILTGSVTNEAGAPVFAHTLVVFPVDRTARLSSPISRVRAVRPDSRGRYEIRGLPPGEYLIALAAELHSTDLDSEAFSALEPGAVRVNLIEGQETVQNLRARAGG